MRQTRSQTQKAELQTSQQQQPIISTHQPSPQTQPRNLPFRHNADFEKVKNMIQFFRVYELQRLLLSLNLSHNGRKIELQNRLVDALQQNFNLIAPQIREIYKTCGPDIVSLTSNSALPQPPPEKRMYQPQLSMQPVQPTQHMVGNMVPFPTANMTAGYPIHPDVRLKKLPFYDEMGTLIQPSTLVPQNNAQRLQEASFYFTLTPSQATDIASNRDIRGGSKIEHTVQVQLRFCLLETSCEQEDCFPPQVIVKVNNKICQLPNPIPTNRPNVEPKRPPRPVNVTSNVKLSPTVTNNVTVQWVPDFTRGYVLAAYLVRKLSSTQLLQRMKTKGIKPADYTRGLIKEKLTEDADCEIATTMLKVSLICPLGKMRMSIPCRASTCLHLQCFDASLFLQMNERKPTWNCPVCDKPAVYENLVIDGYFQEVLASSLLTCDDTEIQLHKDGSWSTHVMRNETQVVDTPNKTVQKVEVISDDLEVITTEPEIKPAIKQISSTLSNNNNNNTNKTNNNEPTSTTNNETTVDLTLSDSDEDLPLKRPSAQQTNSSNGQKKPIAVVNANKAKNDDSIISLDSPSPPPSSPSNNSASTVGTTTSQFCPLLPDPLDTADLFPSNFQINPLALNRASKRQQDSDFQHQDTVSNQAQSTTINYDQLPWPASILDNRMQQENLVPKPVAKRRRVESLLLKNSENQISCIDPFMENLVPTILAERPAESFIHKKPKTPTERKREHRARLAALETERNSENQLLRAHQKNASTVTNEIQPNPSKLNRKSHGQQKATSTELNETVTSENQLLCNDPFMENLVPTILAERPPESFIHKKPKTPTERKREHRARLAALETERNSENQLLRAHQKNASTVTNQIQSNPSKLNRKSHGQQKATSTELNETVTSENQLLCNDPFIENLVPTILAEPPPESFIHKKPKTPAERTRKYRARLAALETQHNSENQLLRNDPFIENLVPTILAEPPPESFIHKKPKTPTERSRKYRARLAALETERENQLLRAHQKNASTVTNEIQSNPSKLNRKSHGQQKATSTELNETVTSENQLLCNDPFIENLVPTILAERPPESFIHKKPKTPAERSRKYRARLAALETQHNSENQLLRNDPFIENLVPTILAEPPPESFIHKKPKTPTERSRKYRARLAALETERENQLLRNDPFIENLVPTILAEPPPESFIHKKPKTPTERSRKYRARLAALETERENQLLRAHQKNASTVTNEIQPNPSKLNRKSHGQQKATSTELNETVTSENQLLWQNLMDTSSDSAFNSATTMNNLLNSTNTSNNNSNNNFCIPPQNVVRPYREEDDIQN